MNTTVTASNMQVKAMADQGILINEVANADSTAWDSEATTNQAAPILLRATSTANTKTWYVAYSTKSSSSASATQGAASADLAEGGYTALTLASETVQAASAGVSAKQDVFYVDNGTNGYDDGEGYYVRYTYYLKSSADEITLGLTQGAQNLNINQVIVSGVTGSANLDAALRVAVVIGGKAYIFAPVANATTTYYVAAGQTATTALTSTPQATALGSLPATTAAGTPVEIYLYFEGEDALLKTDSITSTLDNLNVTVKFSLVTNSSAATDNGVTVPNA